MLSRALSLATVTLLIGGIAAVPVWGQNLEAGKSPSQIFAGTCNACHKSPRGLLKTVAPGSLPSYLRQHYTTSSEMAGVLASFLISNGATDTRYQSKDAKQEAKPAAGSGEQLDRSGRRAHQTPPSQEAAKPDADGLSAQTDSARQGRSARRPDSAKPASDGQPPVQAAIDPGPDGRKSAGKQKLGKRGRPGGEEPAKTDGKPDVAKDEPSKSEPAKDDASKSESAKDESKGESKSETAKGDTSKPDISKETSKGETSALRVDPVPPVRPAPPAPVTSAAASSSAPEPTVAPPPPAVPAVAPAVTAAMPPTVPVVPAGPPALPISQ
jgi:hypothetical protein